MLDILDKNACDNITIKKILKHYQGKKVIIKYNLGRNKIEEFEGKILNLYNYLFTVETKKQQIQSFTYTDIITKTIKIYTKKRIT